MWPGVSKEPRMVNQFIRGFRLMGGVCRIPAGPGGAWPADAVRLAAQQAEQGAERDQQQDGRNPDQNRSDNGEQHHTDHDPE